MDVLGTYTLRTLKLNRMRTAVTVVGVALATALILAVLTSALSLYGYVVAAEGSINGTYNAAAFDTDAAAVERASSSELVTEVASLQIEGYALVNPANTATPYVCVAGLSPEEGAADALVDLLSLGLAEGRMPASPDEVALPQTLVTTGVLDVAVGDEVTFDMGMRVDGEGNRLGQHTTTLSEEGSDRLAERIEGAEPRTFTVCGLYENSNPLSYVLGMFGSYVAGYPAITVAAQTPSMVAAASAPGGEGEGRGLDGGQDGESRDQDGESEGQGPLYLAWIGTCDPAAAVDIAVGLLSSPESAVSGNDSYNRLTSFSFNQGFYITLLGVVTVVLGIVMASSVMLIRNSFSISVAQRTRQFGLLSSIGATKRQLKGVVLREAAFLAAVGVPIGVIVSYAGTAVVLWGAQGLISSWIADWWGANPADVELRLAFSPLALLAAVALSAVTVMLSARGPARRAASFTAIDAIRSAADVRIPRRAAAGGRVAGRLFGVPGLVAAKSFRRDAKPRRATVAALTTGVVLVTTAVLLGGYLNALFSTVRPEVAAAQEGSYDIRYWFTEGDVEGYGDSRPTSEEACARIAGVEGATRAAWGLSLSADGVRVAGGDMPGVYSDAFEAYVDGMWEGLDAPLRDASGVGCELFNVTLCFVEDGAFRSWLEGQGLDADALMDPDAPVAVAVNRVKANDGQRYSQIEPFSGETGAVSLVADVFAGSSVDDAAYETLVSEAGEPAAYAGPDEEPDRAGHWHDIEVEIGAVVEESPWWIGSTIVPTLLMPLSALEAVDPALAGEGVGAFKNAFWEVWIASDDPAATELALRDVLSTMGLSATRIDNVAAQMSSNIAMFSTMQVFIWALAAIVALIAATGAFNTMHTSVMLRKREFAVLRSVGMTRRGLYRMLAYECLMYALHALLWAVPVALAVSALLRQACSSTVDGMPFLLPWALLPAAVGALALVGLACAYAVRKVDAGSPIEALRAEAI